MSKPRVIKDYDKLDPAIQSQIKMAYPRGFQKHLILFSNAKRKMISALPFEGEKFNYLIRMTSEKAIAIYINDRTAKAEDIVLSEDADHSDEVVDLVIEDVEVEGAATSADMAEMAEA